MLAHLGPAGSRDPSSTGFVSGSSVLLDSSPRQRKNRSYLLYEVRLTRLFSYISIIKPDVYPAVLRNLIIGALLVNLSVLVVTYAVLPTEQILGGANILSLVGQVAGGTWLRKIIVVDSAIVVSRFANQIIGSLAHRCILALRRCIGKRASKGGSTAS